MELYLTLFTLGFRSSAKSWPPRANLGKGVAVVTLVQTFLIFAAVTWAAVLSRNRDLFLFSKMECALIYLGFAAVNLYFLILRGHGPAFEKSFSKLSRVKQVLLIGASGIVILASFIFFVWGVEEVHKLPHRNLAKA